MSTTVPGSARVPSQPSRASSPRAAETAAPDVPAPASAERHPSRVRDGIHVALIAVAGVLFTVGFALDDTPDADTGTELVAAVAGSPDRFYWSNTIGALGLVLVAAVGLAVMRLVQHRGRALATVGGLLLLIGAPAAAAGQFMYGAVVTGMVESGQDRADMAALQDSLGESARTGLTFVIGFPAVMLGMVVCAAALLVSRVVPRFVPALLIAGVLAVLVLGETPASTVADLLLTSAFIGIAWSLWRATTPGTGAGGASGA